MTDPRDEPGHHPDGRTHTHALDGILGASIGPYRLLERIGEGGMGEVWLAEQVRPVRRQVALKLIKPGLDTAMVVARFEAERQALALMDHTAIAKVFDAGSTDLGRPYFAMEFVRGEAITAYCDRHRLTLRERVELFIHVCEGVQHAHQKGIIHRDLKPSNILVAMQDDRAVPKIIDFGVAKATSRPLTEHTLYTSLGGFVGTPEYMSPEQADMSGVDVDTRTDVFALGVTLYELLTGVLPFDQHQFGSLGFDEVRRTIREVNPPRPSTRVAHSTATSAEAARCRRTDVSRLTRMLHGDLDWITMKAIEKERSRRYATASELAADLRRHLQNEPVLASPPSAVYRVGRFARRHRAGVGVGIMLFLLLTLFVGAMAVQARRIAVERDRANREAATAKQVADFVIGLFKVSDPDEARGNTLTAREILDTGVANIEKELAGQPEVQARIMVTLGTIYTNLGLYDRAERLLDRAVTNDRRLLGQDHAATLEAVHALANVYWFQDKYQLAEPLYLDVTDRRRRLLGDEHPHTLRANADLSSLYALQKRFDESERLIKATLNVQRRVLGNDHADTHLSTNILQGVYFRQGRYADALPIAKEALVMSRRTLGEDHPNTLDDVHNLATVYDRLDRFEEAEPLYLEALNASRRVRGGAHPRTVFTAIRLSAMYQRLKRFADAETQLTASLAQVEAAGTADSAAATSITSALDSLYKAWGKPAKSRNQLR